MEASLRHLASDDFKNEVVCGLELATKANDAEWINEFKCALVANKEMDLLFRMSDRMGKLPHPSKVKAILEKFEFAKAHRRGDKQAERCAVLDAHREKKDPNLSDFKKISSDVKLMTDEDFEREIKILSSAVKEAIKMDNKAIQKFGETMLSMTRENQDLHRVYRETGVMDTKKLEELKVIGALAKCEYDKASKCD